MKKTYYGPQTLQALNNFPFPLPTVSFELIFAITQIKKAAALAHKKAGELDPKIADAIVHAANQILQGELNDQFVTPSVQGGAGTSINMNVNEVLASCATELLQEKDVNVHPNDHVNMSQSTNDVNPSALRLVCIQLTKELLTSAENLAETFAIKSSEFKNIHKLGRTHIQDAIPTTLGAEFSSYNSIILRDVQRIYDSLDYLYDLNLGGTAIGNELNASPEYIEEVYKELQKLTDLPIRKGHNLMSLTSSTTDFCHLSAAINCLALDISKIASDIRFMSSGPRGGIGELKLQALQPGSSIMPGKVNPVLPESMNQIFYFISGKNQTIHQAAEGASLELAIMFPVISEAIISSLKLLTAGIEIFTTSCIQTIQANPDQCNKNLENSFAYATLLTPILGYDQVSVIVKEALQRNLSLRQIILEKKLLTEQEFEKVVKNM